MNSIAQYRATTCSPQFVVVCQGWQYIEMPHNREFLFTDFHGC